MADELTLPCFTTRNPALNTGEGAIERQENSNVRGGKAWTNERGGQGAVGDRSEFF